MASKSNKTLARYKQTQDADSMREPSRKGVLMSLLKHALPLVPKTENQAHFMEALQDKKKTHVFASGCAGTGKAQPLDTPILTPTGWVRMGDITEGDYVISVGGTATKVTGVFPQGEKEIFRVTFSDGSSTECCKEHLWFTQTARDRWDKRKAETGRPGSVKSTEEIQKSLLDGRHANHSIPLVSPIEFEEKRLPIDPYVLGALLGDGCIIDKAMFSSKDLWVLDEISSRLGDEFELVHYKGYDYNIKGAYRKNTLVAALKALNLLGKKSADKFIPQEYLFGSVSQRIDLLRGLMDTDGFVSTNGVDVEFYTISEQLAKDVKFLAEGLGSLVVTKLKETSYKKHGEKYACQPCFRLRFRCNPTINPFGLPRKAERFKPTTKYRPQRFITTVEPVGVKEAQCIMIDDPLHLYLTEHCIVTHNTFLALIAALNLLREGDNEFEEIIILKSVKELEGESIGFLPGDKDEKLQYVYMSYYMQLERILKKEIFDELKTKEFIKILPIGAIRGFSISKKSIVIVDETQNLSEDNTYTVMTRMEAKAKLIVIGDVFQRDRADDNDNGLVFAVQMMKKMKEKLAGTPLADAISITEFTKEDSVRSPFIQHLQGLYEEHLEDKDCQHAIERRQRKQARVEAQQQQVEVKVTNSLSRLPIENKPGFFSFLRG